MRWPWRRHRLRRADPVEVEMAARAEYARDAAVRAEQRLERVRRADALVSRMNRELLRIQQENDYAARILATFQDLRR